ncbi:phage tail protein [Ligilactobacillus cholophilus]|uniref:phage tail protein n=1 Tax=Ligilactobacillus cholophilus TaxID=3050131 RepID=UPI0025B0178C|nr:phage tail protein [Ligilactobacillus cholophilus]
MTLEINFKNINTAGLETSPYATELAGVRAHEARYYWNHFKTKFETFPAQEHMEIVSKINEILAERDLKFNYQPLEIANFMTENMYHLYVFYQNGLSINVMYDLNEPKNRAVGFKLCEHMEIPSEFEGKFKFAKMRSKLAGTIRGTYFKIKKEYSFDK